MSSLTSELFHAESEAIECPSTHKLEQFITEEDDYTCSICERSYLTGTIMHGCRACDYDLCTRCLEYKQEKHGLIARLSKQYEMSKRAEMSSTLLQETAQVADKGWQGLIKKHYTYVQASVKAEGFAAQKAAKPEEGKAKAEDFAAQKTAKAKEIAAQKAEERKAKAEEFAAQKAANAEERKAKAEELAAKKAAKEEERKAKAEELAAQKAAKAEEQKRSQEPVKKQAVKPERHTSVQGAQIDNEDCQDPVKKQAAKPGLHTSVQDTQTDSEDPMWFPCPTCDQVVTSLVRGGGPRNRWFVCRTHCCFSCQTGEGHDSLWCAGSPSKQLRSLRLPDCSLYRRRNAAPAHYILHEPDWTRTPAPAPTLLFLHGASTYTWPETLSRILDTILEKNARARDFIIIAPLAAAGEPLSVVTGCRQHLDRFGNMTPYIDGFDQDLTWKCFLMACDELGSERVDWTRICITGFSMGAEATWDIALNWGSYLAAIAPMAGCCAWPADAWDKVEKIAKELRSLPLWEFNCEQDHWSYNMMDFRWLAEEQNKVHGVENGYGDAVETFTYEVDPAYGCNGTIELLVRSWGSKSLKLIRGTTDSHNCWDLVYQLEHNFGLFTWMASTPNPRGAELRDVLRRAVA